VEAPVKPVKVIISVLALGVALIALIFALMPFVIGLLGHS
jgi:hypothetical protein